MNWQGVLPAITTEFNLDLSVDHAFLAEHCRWLIDQGCSGIVTPGSLGEGATLSHFEKIEIWKTVVNAIGKRAPVVAAISSPSTAEAIELAHSAENAGCAGLMVLPPYIYRGDRAEMEAHLSAVMKASSLSCMLYNNPIAYGTDFLPEQIKELADLHENLHAVKESSGDVRRITAIRALTQDRLALLVGVDDLILEGLQAGAVGWISGVADALPQESLHLFKYGLEKKYDLAFQLYQWLLPLLRMDTVPKFVQLIKLIQKEVGRGSTRVRPPRLELIGSELLEARATITRILEARPPL